MFIEVSKIIKEKNPTLHKWLPSFVIRIIERIIHQKQINEFIEDHEDQYGVDFCESLIKYFNASVHIENLENLPKDEPVVMAMNHPMGGMDAIALVAGLKGYREDLKFIVNDILLGLKNLKGIFVGVDKHSRNGMVTREQIFNLFNSKDAVCIFPAGLVSRKIDGEIMDLQWKKTFITMSKRTNQTIVPVYIDGGLSKFFYNLYLFRKWLGIKANIEMLFLSHEFFKFKNKKIVIRIGKPIPSDQLPKGKMIDN